MQPLSRDKISVPALVKKDKVGSYIDNYLQSTNGRGRFILINTDLNTVRSKPSTDSLLQMLQKIQCGTVVTTYENISKFGFNYPDIPYIVSLTPYRDSANSEKTLLNVKHIETLRRNNVVVNGIEITLYDEDLAQTSYINEIKEKLYIAHREGLYVLIRYRGNSVEKLHLLSDLTDSDGLVYNENMIDAVSVSNFTQNGIVEVGSYLPAKDIVKLQQKALTTGHNGIYLYDNVNDRDLGEIENILAALYQLTYEYNDPSQAVI